MRQLKLILAAALTGMALQAAAQTQTPIRDVNEFNLMNGIGLHGYDPVAVFPEGGGQARPGRIDIQLEYGGVIYLFASETNRDQFLQNPAKYEPTYGGFCAYAMAQGCKIDIDPSIVTLKGDRAHYFVSTRAKRNFDADADRLEAQADANFAKMQGRGLVLGQCL